MTSPENIMVLTLTTLGDGTSFKVTLMTTIQEDKKVLKLAQPIKDAQDCKSSYSSE